MKKSLFRHFVDCCTTDYFNPRGTASAREFWAFCLFFVLFLIPLLALFYWLLQPSQADLALMSASDVQSYSPFGSVLPALLAYILVALPPFVTLCIRRFRGSKGKADQPEAQEVG